MSLDPNPAVTIARSLTNTFSGIAPSSVPLFIVAQLLGAAVALALSNWLLPSRVSDKDKEPKGDLADIAHLG